MQIQKVTHFHVWLFKNFNNYIGSFDLTPKLKGMCNVIPCKCTLTIWYHFVSLISQNGWMSSNVFIRAHLDTFLSIWILATSTSPSPFSHLAIAGGSRRRTCGPQRRRLRGPSSLWPGYGRWWRVCPPPRHFGHGAVGATVEELRAGDNLELGLT